MCGRFSLGSTIRVGDVFNVPNWPDMPARHNIAPGMSIPVIAQNQETGVREVRECRWGLVPSWAQDPNVGYRMINARSESAANKPAFRLPFRERRGLIPAHGFYEWAGKRGRKQPYYIGRRDGELLAFAALWDRWCPPEGAPLESCTILTTEANTLVAPLHDRMPAILPATALDLWLDPTVRDVQHLRTLLTPWLAEDMVAYPVSTYVNDVRHEGPECLAPAPLDAQPALL